MNKVYKLDEAQFKRLLPIPNQFQEIRRYIFTCLDERPDKFLEKISMANDRYLDLIVTVDQVINHFYLGKKKQVKDSRGKVMQPRSALRFVRNTSRN